MVRILKEDATKKSGQYFSELCKTECIRFKTYRNKILCEPKLELELFFVAVISEITGSVFHFCKEASHLPPLTITQMFYKMSSSIFLYCELV